ncbi:GAF domain-containing sensor histidine kinase [Trinickia dinghuensis]|uniref:histidine kinase n=1 Tax=Trinickia dinghuensis TaxID=2291023 RepID=A0A3D8K5K4_9BURK|nr:ATP-binding protein [Trinickia dinghuensis]RDV00500.1 GAF domain-containing protein [Trinickia dinghuensis]
MRTMNNELDVHALRDVSTTMATETPPARRIEKLLEAAIRSMKATWGFIAVMREGGWQDAVGAAVSGAPNTGAPRLPVEGLPVSILTTAVRLRNGLALYDACAAEQWQTDDYVRLRKPRSVICVPIRCNGALMGALYLEHQTSPGIFTPAKTAMVEIIALQAGFMLENARLRDELSEQHTRRGLTEAKMRDTLSELDRASRLKAYGELAASIVHEVVQPVTALDTSARAGLKWLERSAPNIDAARETLAHICACAMRARAIIDALRAKARQAAPTFTVFDLADALREAAELVACTLDAMKVRLSLHGLSSPTPVRGERVQLQQAFVNLLTNGAESMRHTPEAERVLVLACESAPSLVRVRIDDRGEGFDPQSAPRLFEPLFTTKPHGMGMGLSICKSIVEAHHGRLELTPRLEGGTRATVTLPQFSS